MIINREELLLLMEDFYKFTNMRIVVFDDAFIEVATYPNRHSSFCKELRSNDELLKRCKECDYNACMIAKKSKSSYIYKCHAGLTEVVSPIMIDEKIVGYIMLGQILEVNDYETSWSELNKYISNFDLDSERVKKLYFKKRNFTHDRIISASKIMEACAAYLMLSKLVALNEDSTAKELDNYIIENLSKEIDVEKICADLNLSRVKLYAISERSYGMGIAEHIRKIRVDEAQKLLIRSNKRIGEIADSCGFYDYNYFTKVFKKYVGLTPRDYRKKFSKESAF